MEETAYPIDYLIIRFMQGQLDAGERLQLDNWLKKDSNRAYFEELMNAENFRNELLQYRDATKNIDKIQETIMQGVKDKLPGISTEKFKQLKWWVPRAAAGLLLAIGVVVYFTSFREKYSMKISAEIKSAIPATDKAILTFPDKSALYLNTLVKDTIYKDKMNAQFSIKNSRISYNTQQPLSANGNFYTLSTPIGGTCILILSDGTLVSLNAGSTIRFPVIFRDKCRKVELSGEAYFEVAKDTTRPFEITILNTKGEKTKNEIEVLGTHFIVNAYDISGVIKTSLLEGIVKVITGSDNVTLREGYEAIISKKPNIAIREKSNKLPQAGDWQNEKFNFREKDIYSIMAEIGRWYNVDIVFEPDLPDVTYDAEIERKRSLPEVINIISERKEILLLYKKNSILVKKNKNL